MFDNEILLSKYTHLMSNEALIERSELAPLVAFCQKHPSVVQTLIGPRQVGKTTLAKQLMAKLPFPAVYASADAPLPPGPEWIETQWRMAELKTSQTKGPVLLILDEIQKVKGWSEVIKQKWDEKVDKSMDIRLLILGSSSLLIQDGLSESLSGRFFLHRCPHWSFPECRQAFGWSLNQWLFYGGYPGAAAFVDTPDNWKQYVTDSLIETVLARDVLQLQQVRKPALLRHLFLLAAAYPAQILSYNKMLGQLMDAGNTTTLAHYVTLLESAFLVSGLDVFSKGVVRQRAGSPKLIVWNNALVNALSPLSFEETLRDTVQWGRLVENAVGAYLLNRLSPTSASISHWRVDGHEVDFVIQQGQTVWAIEVKGGKASRTQGLRHFRQRYPESKVLIVGGNGIPLETFFETPPDELLKP